MATENEKSLPGIKRVKITPLPFGEQVISDEMRNKLLSSIDSKEQRLSMIETIDLVNSQNGHKPNDAPTETR